MDLNATLVFVNVVKAGSFSKAAKDLAVPVSTVSDRVANLEKSLGVRLLNRTTRSLNLTDPGREFFEKAEAALASLIAATEEATSMGASPSGTLRITAPTDHAVDTIAAAVAEYREKFPAVKVELLFTNRRVDLILENFDIAIRGGELQDSSLVAKKISAGNMIFVATAKYMKSRPEPKHPRDLESFDYLHFQRIEQQAPDTSVRLKTTDGRTALFRPDYKAASTDLQALVAMAKLGAGVTLAPEPMVYDELVSKELVRVLPEWSTGEMPVHLVYQPQKYSLPKVKEMVPILEKRFKARISACEARQKK